MDALEKDQEKPVEMNLQELPDYMTLRQNRMKEKKAKQLNYTLDITNGLPKPNYKNVKSKLHDSIVPDAVEKSLHNQIQFLKDQSQLADTPFISSLKTA